jgi:hypothetical protein
MRRLGALLFSGLAPGNKPDDNPDYDNRVAPLFSHVLGRFNDGF